MRMWELREVVEEYELHSRRSTAVNEVLMCLRPAHSSPEWQEALKVNLLSMWLHQVLAFEQALATVCRHGRYLARQKGRPLSDFGRLRKAGAASLWPQRSSAITVYCHLSELGELLAVESDPQFEHETTVAPRHFIWRDAWAHRGGRLQEHDAQTYDYFLARDALEERAGSAWPLDPALQEARLSFQQLVRLLASPQDRIAPYPGQPRAPER